MAGPTVVLAVLALLPPYAPAQETRAEVLQRQQEQKSRALSPPRPNRVERFMKRLETKPRGLYPWFGSVYSGGGVAAGAGVRMPFGDDGALIGLAGYSIARFARAQADLALPTFAQNRARLTFAARYIDAPDVRFFGTGNASRPEDAVRFGYTPKSAGARLDVEATRRFSVGGSVELLDIDTSPGRTGPSIEERFSAADAPGLGVPGFTFINSSAFAAFDSRRAPGYSGRGGLYRVRLDDYRERDNDRYSFTSVEAEAVHLVPILRANWVIALRGLATLSDVGDTHDVPFFLLASLGGGTTLRGYPDFRFRDRNRLLMSAELRWTPARFMDMAIFYDMGKVASRRTDLGLRGLKDSYGIGMRLIGREGYVMRLELARSREHAARLIISAGGVF